MILVSRSSDIFTEIIIVSSYIIIMIAFWVFDDIKKGRK